MTLAASHGWTFLTNHTHVMLCIWEQPGILVRDIAGRVGITERATLRIIRDLEAAGFLSIEKSGRQNRYQVSVDLPLRHPLERQHTVGELLRAIAGSTPVTQALQSEGEGE